MLPGLQPSRSKPPQQSALPTYAQQQRRAFNEAPRLQHPPHTLSSHANIITPKPHSQVEAMPPFGPPHTPTSFFTPFYDSAVRHPVFFTQNLKKPPFTLPQTAGQGWNPVASGYIVEHRKVEAAGKTKL